MMYALVDCNNFYASCERLFRPDLAHQPIVVLSNNDGCVIARSNEAKTLGIGMGEPYFKIKGLCKKQQIHVFSSNYTLYGDLSHRVMSIISESWPNVEVYSIDEAFLDLSALPYPETFCLRLQQQLLQYTGIPTSVGIGKTKTLAKLANVIAKKHLKTPVFILNVNNEQWFKHLPVEEIWGVGRQWSKQLHARHIYTVSDLRQANPLWVRKTFNVMLQRTVYELMGQACIARDDVKPKQSIQCSRSFASLQTEYGALAQAVSKHCARAFEQLRQHQLQTQHIAVFIHSNRFRQELAQHHPFIDVTLPQPTDDIRRITQVALSCLKKIYRCDIHYQKAGILLTDLSPKSRCQLELFTACDHENEQRSEQLMQVLDQINRRFGRQTLHLATNGASHSQSSTSSMRSAYRSSRYTTNWNELPVVLAT